MTMDQAESRIMNQSKEPPPPPPDFPPPSQTRRSRRSRSNRSSNNVQERSSETMTKEKTTTQQQHVPPVQDNPAVSASARTVTHQNTAHPSSYTATTVEEQKTAMHAMEMGEEALPTPDARLSRFPRMPWSKHPFDAGADGIMGDLNSFGEGSVEGLYYGDVMSSFPLPEDDVSIRGNYSADSLNEPASRFRRLRRNIATSLRSSFSMKSSRSNQDTDDDNESLNDFKEWTPPDSAYGAAFPICGWIPKHYRRLMEATLFALFVLVLVFFVVSTSIRVSMDQNSDSSQSNSGSNKVSDDDYYIDYDNYHYNNADDDEVEEAADDDAAMVDDDAMNDGDDDDVAADDEEGGEEEEENDEDAEDQEDAEEDQDEEDDEGRLFLRLF